MATPKYQALIIHRQALYVNADGTPLAQQPTETAALMDSFKPVNARNYMYVEVYSNLGKVAGNTIYQIITDLNSRQQVPYNAVLYYTYKAGKPFQSQPVGQTWLPTA